MTIQTRHGLCTLHELKRDEYGLLTEIVLILEE